MEKYCKQCLPHACCGGNATLPCSRPRINSFGCLCKIRFPRLNGLKKAQLDPSRWPLSHPLEDVKFGSHVELDVMNTCAKFQVFQRMRNPPNHIAQVPPLGTGVCLGTVAAGGLPALGRRCLTVDHDSCAGTDRDRYHSRAMRCVPCTSHAPLMGNIVGNITQQGSSSPQQQQKQ
jgi:hypothetical protein